MTKHRRIYAASSWRNPYQPTIVRCLREWGHEVYDFRNPVPGNTGFSWSEIDPNWKAWNREQYRDALHHDIAKQGYCYDMGAMQWCDTCLLILPAGRSASFELGWCMGAGREGFIFMAEMVEPELMWREATILVNERELCRTFL